MQFSFAQKKQFYTDGYTVVRGAIPQVMVDDALRAINHHIGEGIDKSQVHIYRSQSFLPELKNEPVITDLFNKSSIVPLAESVLGEGAVPEAIGGQIALRFPSLQDPPPEPRPHLDGLHSPNNGVPAGEVRNFSMLVVVLLRDVDAPYSGNFTVWPGTHHQYEAYFKEHGTEALHKGASEGMPQIDLPEPQFTTGKAGDVIFASYHLGHTAAPNISPNTRYAVIFRIHHTARPNSQMNLDAMTNMWIEWPGMADVLEVMR